MPNLAEIVPLRRQGNHIVSEADYIKPVRKRKRKLSKFKMHEFLCFDGEGFEVDGRHEYVYLAAFNGKHSYAIRNDNGLRTMQCFRFLINVTRHNPNGIGIIYGGSYDANMMLRDVSPSCLKQIRERGWTLWRQYRIEFVPWKFFQITDQTQGITCRIWDVIGFFQMSFVDALDKWLGVTSQIINKGKAKRSKFTADDIENIISYCQEELRYFEQLAQHLWECLDRVGVEIRRWDGAGSIAQTLLGMYGIYEFKGTKEQQDANYFFARCAYAGGRFENFRPGDFLQPIYAADINSAYPFAIAQLPEFRGLEECTERTHSRCKISQYDLLHLDYSGPVEYPIHPYFHRGKRLEISYPHRTRGWHWACEYLAARAANGPGKTKILRHFIYVDNGTRPFKWVEDQYLKRLVMKRPGPTYDPGEKVIKLGLNSLYGKLAQQRGWKEGKPIPRFHQLYWAGWVTAKCRSLIYEACMQAPDAIIAVETDSVISTVKLNLPYGEGLGEWELTEYDWITYVQSGLYFAGIGSEQRKLRSRGINARSISRNRILDGWANYDGTIQTDSVATQTKRFHTLGSSLATGHMEHWRQWRTQQRLISLVPTKTGKRGHLDPLCGPSGCEGWGPGKTHTTLARHLPNLDSEPYAVLWDEDKSEILEEMYLEREIDREEAMIND